MLGLNLKFWGMHVPKLTRSYHSFLERECLFVVNMWSSDIFVNNLILGSFHFVLNLNKSILLSLYRLVCDLIWVAIESEVFWGAVASFCTTTMTSHKLVDCNDAQFGLKRKIKISIQLLPGFVNNWFSCRQYILRLQNSLVRLESGS